MPGNNPQLERYSDEDLATIARIPMPLPRAWSGRVHHGGSEGSTLPAPLSSVWLVGPNTRLEDDEAQTGY